MTIGRNERCPCGSGKKYKKCHGNITELSLSALDTSVTCICGSNSRPYECCGAFLASECRRLPSYDSNQFVVENWYQEEFKGKVFFARLSTSRKEWNVFRNFYLYGIEIEGRFFRPRTLDQLFEGCTDDASHWTVKCNLDYRTGASLKFVTPLKLEVDKLQVADCTISVTEPLNKIETPYIRIINNQYLRLFHHTSVQGYDGITSSKTIWTSPYDLQGSTRKLKQTNFAYFTDLPELKYEGDLFAVAMREKGRAIFRTDDLSQFDHVDIYDNPPYKREKRLTFYIDLRIIVPVPAIFHYQDGSRYIEFFHPHIFRVAAEPDSKIGIVPYEDGWSICDSTISSRATNIYPIANGNILSDLFEVYQDRYIEP